jgi:mono/diheme cytochrome c family protein
MIQKFLPRFRGVLRGTYVATAALAAASVLASCGGEGPAAPADPPDPDPDVSLTAFEAVQSVFTRSCAFSGCHAGAAPKEGLDLSAGALHSNTVRVASVQVPSLYRIDPSRPDSSYLLLKLQGLAGAVGGIGTQMPLGGQLTPAQIDSVRAWVLSGAPDR